MPYLYINQRLIKLYQTVETRKISIPIPIHPQNSSAMEILIRGHAKNGSILNN